MTVSLKRYDKMEFHNVVLAEVPVQIYQPVTVNGQMLYDYDKNCWFLTTSLCNMPITALLKLTV